MIEIDVNDYLDEADTDLMIEELLSRKSRADTLKQLKEMFTTLDSEDMLNILIDKNNYSILEADLLK